MRHISARAQNQGMMVISMLAILAVFAVLIAFSGISITQDPAAAEMKVAVRSLEYSFKAARQAARIYQTAVELHLPSADDKLNSISYTVSMERKSEYLLEFERSGFILPEGVRVESDHDVIEFNASGQVEPPAQLILISSTDENFRERILVE